MQPGNGLHASLQLPQMALLSRRLPQQLQAPLPRRIDINPHSNQTLLKHAPVEWNFLLNKVLLTQLPAPWAQAELSSSGSRSRLMNPLKYRLIGIAALALAEPVLPQAPLGSSGRGAWKPSVASPPTLIPAQSPRSNWMFCGLKMRRWQWGIRRMKIVIPLLHLLSSQASVCRASQNGAEKGQASQKERGIALPSITSPGTT